MEGALRTYKVVLQSDITHEKQEVGVLARDYMEVERIIDSSYSWDWKIVSSK